MRLQFIIGSHAQICSDDLCPAPRLCLCCARVRVCLMKSQPIQLRTICEIIENNAICPVHAYLLFVVSFANGDAK